MRLPVCVVKGFNAGIDPKMSISRQTIAISRASNLNPSQKDLNAASTCKPGGAKKIKVVSLSKNINIKKNSATETIQRKRRGMVCIMVKSAAK